MNAQIYQNHPYGDKIKRFLEDTAYDFPNLSRGIGGMTREEL